MLGPKGSFAKENKVQAFATILMEPPWNERGGGKIVRGAQRHYPLLKTREMPRVIYQSGVWRPAENAHLYMWATNQFLDDALWLIKALGFKYKTNVVWVKQGGFGLGQYFRGSHEILLFATRGKGYEVRTQARSIPSVVTAERKRHSEKPEQFYDLIESRSQGPYVELFCRRPREGWTVWGNEV